MVKASRDPMSLSDSFSVFFDDDGEKESWSRSRNCFEAGDWDDETDEVRSVAEESKAFWDEQPQLLQVALNRTSTIERRIRIKTEEALKKIQSLDAFCRCPDRPTKESCRNCVLSYITDRLQDAGYNSALCTSKWRRSPDIPSGEHSYVDVVVDGKKSPVRLVIELNFRAEFEMARASPEYCGLVGRLPEMFVGKSEKLGGVVKIMCAAAKRCMKENKMYMAPWRKHKYMQSKWLGTCQRILPAAPLVPVATRNRDRQSKSTASMLTFDLYCNTVEVLI